MNTIVSIFQRKKYITWHINAIVSILKCKKKNYIKWHIITIVSILKRNSWYRTTLQHYKILKRYKLFRTAHQQYRMHKQNNRKHVHVHICFICNYTCLQCHNKDKRIIQSVQYTDGQYTTWYFTNSLFDSSQD